MAKQITKSDIVNFFKECAISASKHDCEQGCAFFGECSNAYENNNWNGVPLCTLITGKAPDEHMQEPEDDPRQISLLDIPGVDC